MDSDGTVNQTPNDKLKTEDLFKKQPNGAHGMNPMVKLILEIGPLAIFFFCNAQFGIYFATGAFMAAMAVSLITSYIMVRKVPTMPLITGIFVGVFGTLTLVLHDDLFIKLKPTIVNSIFACILFGGLLFKRPLLRPLMGEMFHLDEKGWMIMTFRWACFFVVLAILNEIVWRNFSTDDWVNFKVFGIMPLTILFSMLQIPLLKRHHSERKTDLDKAHEDF